MSNNPNFAKRRTLASSVGQLPECNICGMTLGVRDGNIHCPNGCLKITASQPQGQGGPMEVTIVNVSGKPDPV